MRSELIIATIELQLCHVLGSCIFPRISGVRPRFTWLIHLIGMWILWIMPQSHTKHTSLLSFIGILTKHFRYLSAKNSISSNRGTMSLIQVLIVNNRLSHQVYSRLRCFQGQISTTKIEWVTTRIYFQQGCLIINVFIQGWVGMTHRI